MSKSDENAGAYVLMKDSRDTVMSKFKRAVTDSGSEIVYDPENKPGVSNLIEIYSCAASKTVREAEKEFEGLGYGKLKEAVGEAVADALEPIQARFEKLVVEKDEIKRHTQRARGGCSAYGAKDAG
jgi:tryptophanyl-tRNA synthetase